MKNNVELAAEKSTTIDPLYIHVAKTYAWMFLGLLVTFAVSFFLISTGLIYYVFAIRWMPIILLVAQLALVWYLSSRIMQFSVNTARLIFLAYAMLTGVVFGSMLLLYGFEIALTAFGMAAVYFGIMSVAGLVTKRDLSGLRPIIITGLITLLILQVVAIIFNFGALDTVLCYAGVILFLGITAYDAKKVKDYYHLCKENDEMLEKISIFSALSLYLDFINIFIYLMRILGRRR